jgi:hypothetical protein
MSEIQETPKSKNGLFITLIAALAVVIGIMGYKMSNTNKALDDCEKSNKMFCVVKQVLDC